MTEYIFWYAIFALTTSFTSLYELVLPVILKERKNTGKDTLSVFLLVAVFFISNTIIAPLIFLSCIIPSFGDRFRDSLHKGLYSKT
jgi:hypothetical protein